MEAATLLAVMKSVVDADAKGPKQVLKAIKKAEGGEEFLKLSLGDLLKLTIGDLLETAVELDKE